MEMVKKKKIGWGVLKKEPLNNTKTTRKLPYIMGSLDVIGA